MSNIAGLDAITTPPPTTSSVTATTSPGWSVVKSHTTTSSDLTIPPPPSLFSHSHPDTLHYSTATVLYPKTSAESSYYNIGDYDMMRTSTPPEIWAHPSPLKELEIPEFRMLNDTHKKLDSPYLPFYPMQQQHQHQLPLPPPPPPPVLPQASRERYHPRFKSANARLSCHPENYHQPVQFLSPPLVPNSLYSPPSNSKRPNHTKQAADRRMHSLL